MKKFKVNGVTLVTESIAKDLKDLGWCWETPAILQLSTGIVVTPTRKINTNIGNEFAPLPAIQQVISWLDMWGIHITSYGSMNNIEELNCKVNLFIEDIGYKDLIVKSDDEQQYSWEDIMLKILPETLKILKTSIFEKESNRYTYMVKSGAITLTNFYINDTNRSSK